MPHTIGGMMTFMAALDFENERLRFLARYSEMADQQFEGLVEEWESLTSMQKQMYSISLKGGDVSTPAFSPDGQYVATGVYGT